MTYFSLLGFRKRAFTELAAGRYLNAAQNCAKALEVSGLAPNDCLNLSFICQEYLSISEKTSILQRIKPLKLETSDNIDALFLIISLTLQVSLEKGKQDFESIYLDKVLKPSVVEKRDPLLFWHIPKCSGTSVCQALAHKHYGKSLREIIPGYTYAPMLKVLIEEYHDAAPFISANHLHTHEINIPHNVTEFTILRDPLKRALSMYRQEAPTHHFKKRAKQILAHFWGKDKTLQHQRRHYKVLPRYRHFWDYRKDATFEGWLRSIPNTLLNSQTYTFSNTMDPQKAVSRASKLSSIKIDPTPEDYNDLFSKLDLGLNYKDIPGDLNSSSKRIKVSDRHLELLKEKTQKDKSFISLLNNR